MKEKYQTYLVTPSIYVRCNMRELTTQPRITELLLGERVGEDGTEIIMVSVCKPHSYRISKTRTSGPNISEIPGHNSRCCACCLFIFDAFCLQTWSPLNTGVFNNYHVKYRPHSLSRKQLNPYAQMHDYQFFSEQCK